MTERLAPAAGMPYRDARLADPALTSGGPHA